MHTALLKDSKVDRNAILDGSRFHCTVARGKTSICSSLFLCVSVDELTGVSSSGKFGLDAQHTVAGLLLLVHGRFNKISTARNHFFSVLENAS